LKRNHFKREQLRICQSTGVKINLKNNLKESIKKSSLQVNDQRVLVAVGNDDGFVELYDSLFHNIIEKEQVKPG